MLSRLLWGGRMTLVAGLTPVLVAFVVGLCCSITLCEGALILLTLLWLWRLRDPAVRAAQTWPLGRPVLAFAAATLLSALASGHVAASLAASKGLLRARGCRSSCVACSRDPDTAASSRAV